MSNIAKVLTSASKDIVDFLLRRWRPNTANIDKLASSITAMRLSESDTVFLDLCSISAYMGTDRDGLPVAAKTLPVDGECHLRGDLQTAPRQVFCRSLKDCLPILEAASAAAVVLIAPTPRYVWAVCSENTDHVLNIETNNDFTEEELHCAVSHFRSAVASLPQCKISQVFDIYQQFGQDSYAARDLDTSDGLSIWQNRDPVHLTDTTYMEISMSLQGDHDDEVFQPPKMRQRLESMVPPKPANVAKAVAFRSSRLLLRSDPPSSFQFFVF